MFGMVNFAISINQIESNIRFNESLKKMSPSEASIAIKERNKIEAEAEQHRKDLRVAEASAPKITVNNYIYPEY